MAGKAIAGSAYPFHRQDVEDMAEDSRDNCDPRDSQQEERIVYLHSPPYRRALRDSEVVDCAVLGEMILTARKLLSHRASDMNLSELEKKARRNGKKWARNVAKVKRKLRSAKDRTSESEGDVQENGQGTKCRTAERGINSYAVGSPKSRGSRKVESRANKKEK